MTFPYIYMMYFEHIHSPLSSLVLTTPTDLLPLPRKSPSSPQPISLSPTPYCHPPPPSTTPIPHLLPTPPTSHPPSPTSAFIPSPVFVTQWFSSGLLRGAWVVGYFWKHGYLSRSHIQEKKKKKASPQWTLIVYRTSREGEVYWAPSPAEFTMLCVLYVLGKCCTTDLHPTPHQYF